MLLTRSNTSAQCPLACFLMLCVSSCSLCNQDRVFLRRRCQGTSAIHSWSALECVGVRWSALECVGVRWSALEQHCAHACTCTENVCKQQELQPEHTLIAFLGLCWGITNYWDEAVLQQVTWTTTAHFLPDLWGWHTMRGAWATTCTNCCRYTDPSVQCL